MTSKTAKYFPIKTATACKLKWTWSTLYLPGRTTGSCHRTAWTQLTPENFANFHNTEKKLHERTQMLAGEWPSDSCGYCKEVEQAGGFSDRMLHLNIPDQIPEELAQDPSAIHVTPRILEVFLNNTCNLACLYCWEENSSKIDFENKKFGLFNQNGIVLSNTFENHAEALFPLLLEWLSKHYSSLERLHILGGEPFYQKEFDTLLEFLQTQHNPNCELSIVTNLMMQPKILVKYTDLIKQLIQEKRIKRFDITCSLDCWGPQQEYIRYGLDLNTWEKNFEYVLEQKWIKVNVNQVVTPLTIKTMPEFLEKLTAWRKQKNIGHFFSVASPGPSYMIPKIFGPGEFDKDFENILQLMPVDTNEQRNAKEYMEGIAHEYLSSVPNTEEIQKLIIFLNEKDRRRNTNWRELFPWLEKYVV